MLQVEILDCPGGPIEAADALQGEYICFLDSSLPGKYGRWSFLGVEPFSTITYDQGTVLIDGRPAGCDPFAALSEMLARYRMAMLDDAPPFACGAMGYLSYDLCRMMEAVPSIAMEDLPQPDMCFAFYDCTIAFDLESGRAYLCYLTSASRKAEDIKRRLRSHRPSEMRRAEMYEPGMTVDWAGVESGFTRDEYIRAVERVKDYIAAGDVYQINLSQRFSKHVQLNAWNLYNIIRQVNPSPFGCYLDFPELSLASASPERLLHLDGGTGIVETRPIKGTRPRGSDTDADANLAKQLRESQKDRAENVMIVDMERNDLGRVCEFGSVHVPELWAIEEHPNVLQMVSTVRGRLRRDRTIVDLLAASFPGGSITGAPKVRAMQIIEEIEPVRRGIYTGSVGYIDFRGNSDFNIIIRSAVIRDGRAYFHGGGGIVADSDPESEYQETLDKVSGLVAALSISQHS